LREKLIKKISDHIKKNKHFYCLTGFVSIKLLIDVDPAWAAANDIYRCFKLATLMQTLIYVSSLVCGFSSVIQWQLGSPSWKDRLVASLGGFTLAMLLPSLFDAIKAALN